MIQVSKCSVKNGLIPHKCHVRSECKWVQHKYTHTCLELNVSRNRFNTLEASTYRAELFTLVKFHQWYIPRQTRLWKGILIGTWPTSINNDSALNHERNTSDTAESMNLCNRSSTFFFPGSHVAWTATWKKLIRLLWTDFINENWKVPSSATNTFPSSKYGVLYTNLFQKMKMRNCKCLG